MLGMKPRVHLARRRPMCDERVMPRVKVLFHDNCFDGAASRGALHALLRREQVDAARLRVRRQGATAAATSTATRFDGDVNAVVDFRYSRIPSSLVVRSPRLGASRCPATSSTSAPHPSGRSSSTRRRELHQVPGRRAPRRSSAGTLEPLRELVRLGRHHRRRAVRARRRPGRRAGRAGAQADDWSSRTTRIRRSSRSFIGEMQHEPLKNIAPSAVREGRARAALGARTRSDIDSCARAPSYEHGVVIFDVADERLDANNKFIPYLLFPDVPLRRLRVADGDARQGVGRLEPVEAGAAHRQHRRARARSTAAAAIRSSARCRCRRASWCARARRRDEIAETLRRAAP